MICLHFTEDEENSKMWFFSQPKQFDCYSQYIKKDKSSEKRIKIPKNLDLMQDELKHT